VNHDQLFKALLTTFFIDFVRAFLPDAARYIDADSIEFLDKEIFTDISSAERHEVDLVVKVRFRGGKKAFFLIHVENQASWKKDFAVRMFRYFARLHEKHGLPVFPIALFSFDRPLRAVPDRYQLDFPDFRVLDFAFRAIQLNRLDWRDFVRKPNPVASALMTKMRISEPDRPKVKLECLRMLATLKLDIARSSLIAAFMANYLKLTSRETVVYNRLVKTVAPKERKAVMQFTNEWIEEGLKKGRREGRKEGRKEGRQKGRQEGREEGREEGRRQARALIIRQLGRRLGRVSESLSRQIQLLDDTSVFALGDALLDFTGPSDAKKWLAQHAKN
jgi:predicted transposase YdaD